MAEAAKTMAKGKQNFVQLNDFHIPYGIKLLKKRPKKLLIESNKNQDGLIECSITSIFKNPQGVVMGDPKLHYEGQYKFSEHALEAKKIKLPDFSPVSFKGDLETLIYNPKRLFMSGLFDTITDINSFDGKTLITTVEDTSEKEFFKGMKNPKFIAAPVLVDAMFQTGGLFEFFTTSRTVLPYKIKTLKFYKNVQKHTQYFCITEKKNSGEETNTYDLKLVDKLGTVLIDITSFEMVKLNRIEPEDRIAKLVEFTPAKSKERVKS